MKKKSISKIFIVILIVLIVLPIVFLLILAVAPKYTTISSSTDSTILVKSPGLFDSVPDSTIVAAPDPHKLYPVGRTPKTIYNMGYSGSTSIRGYILKEKVKIFQGPVILLKVDKNTQTLYPYNFINRYTNFVYLKGAKEIQLFFHINTKHLSQYRYRILVNDTAFIHWQQPQATTFLKKLFPTLSDSSIYSTERMPESIREKRKHTGSVLLANINAYGKKITLQLYNVNNPKGTATVILYDKPFEKPKITRINGTIERRSWTVNSEKSFTLNFDSSLSSFFPRETKPKIYINELKKFRLWINPIVASKFYDVSIKNTSSLLSKTYQILPGILNEPDYMFDVTPVNGRWAVNNPGKFIKKPGTYKITVTPELPHYHLKFHDIATSVEFTVLPPSEEVHTYTLWQVLPYLWIFLVIVLLIFLWYRARQKKKLKRSQLQTQIARVQLNTIRLQLNPHFVFNALSGIQNLMNKKDIDNANRYLGKFSRLTRSVLDDGFKESIPIADELKLLDDYLKMEQLRFGFQYSIHSDEDIDAENTEIPSMLFQPFVENAVKYGVYQKESDGIIRIDVLQEEKNIVLRVTDNGNGFDTEKEYEGLGIKLSLSRIDLLNSLQKSTEITLDLKSGEEGTVVSVYLKNWV